MMDMLLFVLFVVLVMVVDLWVEFGGVVYV